MMRILLTVAILSLPSWAIAANGLTALHPEEAYPDDTRQVAPQRYTGFIQSVQKKLHESGFNAGPVNGELEGKTQAALAQFQLSRTLPASGALDDQTLAALGIERDTASE
jgi:peptidoglycan hydrolase-like protein with peptidoglycan-binding domain